MKKLNLFLALVVLCLLAGACGDDDPVKPQEFAVSIRVKDLAGNPVEGLRVGLVNDHDYFQDGAAVDKASTRLEFIVPVMCRVRLSVEDIEGREIRLLTDGDMMAGVHQIIWDGCDNSAVHQPSGRFTVHMVAMELGTGLLLFEDRKDMLLAMLDSSRVPAGYTNAAGNLVLKDRKLFPHLYDRDPLTATDETGESLGLFDLTTQMRVSLTDTSGLGSMNFVVQVTGSGNVDLVWNPPPPFTAEGVAGEIDSGNGPLVESRPPPLMEFRLSQPSPNPFN